MMCFTFLHSPYSICQVFFLINMVYDDEITYMYNHYRKKYCLLRLLFQTSMVQLNIMAMVQFRLKVLFNSGIVIFNWIYYRFDFTVG